jgi:hypothetical protein
MWGVEKCKSKHTFCAKIRLNFRIAWPSKHMAHPPLKTPFSLINEYKRSCERTYTSSTGPGAQNDISSQLIQGVNDTTSFNAINLGVSERKWERNCEHTLTPSGPMLMLSSVIVRKLSLKKLTSYTKLSTERKIPNISRGWIYPESYARMHWSVE